MKITLILVVFSSSVIGVFADTDDVSVSVMEGDSVTLHTGVTEIQGSESIEWKFNGTRIATIKSNSPSTEGTFRDTMKLNNITGDLKITNIRSTDSGLYKLNKKVKGRFSEITFNVTVISGVKSLSVMEGDSVTLNTGVNELQRDDVIQWRHQNNLTYNNESLKLDKSGSLTITNITTEHAGVYEVEIIITISSSSSRYTIHKSFSVNVTDEQKSVSVMEGDSVTLNSSLTKIQRDDEIRWSFKKTTIAKIIKADQRFSTYDDDLDERFRGRLNLDHLTGSLTITNIRNRDSGEYQVEISSSRFIVHKRISVTVNDADKDQVKTVFGTVGESVTLKLEKKSDELIQWRFGPQNTVIAELLADSSTVYPDERFRDRLELDDDTGSLTITDIRNTHSGDYEAGIRSRGSSYTIHKTFSVSVTDVNSMSVKEGESFSLRTGLARIQTNDVILWRFGDQDDIIASLNGPDVHLIWSNVNLNKQTGDLTISNIRRNQFGDYKVEINTINMISHRKYHIISEIVKLVLVKEGDSVTLHTDASISRDDAVLWFGDEGVRITPLTGPVDPRWKNTVQNDRTGDLTIKNIRRDQSGDYKVIFMNINGVSKHKKFHINITDLSPAAPDSGLSSAAIVGIVVVLLVFAAAATAGVIYSRHKRSKPGRTREVNGQNHTSDKDEETELTKPAETVAVL